ncbi:MAG: helix-turn-helix transcriptional regulator [Actinobacteria bacterium]|nr:helix-turn-helix transcriptional regulator [Actinomycetota bacterium]
MPSEMQKGHVDLLLLSVLERDPAHGYGLVEALRERSEGAFELAEGTVYPALYRLERQRLVASAWDTVGGRKRRVYRLTGRGGRELSRQRSEWRNYVQAVEAVVA